MEAPLAIAPSHSMCSDQTETHGKNKENFSNEIDTILGAIPVSDSLSSPAANVTKGDFFFERNLTSSSIDVETVTLSSSDTTSNNEDSIK